MWSLSHKTHGGLAKAKRWSIDPRSPTRGLHGFCATGSVGCHNSRSHAAALYSWINPLTGSHEVPRRLWGREDLRRQGHPEGVLRPATAARRARGWPARGRPRTCGQRVSAGRTLKGAPRPSAPNQLENEGSIPLDIPVPVITRGESGGTSVAAREHLSTSPTARRGGRPSCRTTGRTGSHGRRSNGQGTAAPRPARGPREQPPHGPNRPRGGSL